MTKTKLDQKHFNMVPQDDTAANVVAQSPTEVCNAIKNFRGWWSEDIEGKTDKLHELFFNHLKDMHHCKIKPIAMLVN